MITSDSGKTFEDYRNIIKYLKQKVRKAHKEKEQLKYDVENFDPLKMKRSLSPKGRKTHMMESMAKITQNKILKS